jgi:hypothetical protein
MTDAAVENVYFDVVLSYIAPLDGQLRQRLIRGDGTEARVFRHACNPYKLG